jgi:hypothetical protein
LINTNENTTVFKPKKFRELNTSLKKEEEYYLFQFNNNRKVDPYRTWICEKDRKAALPVAFPTHLTHATHANEMSLPLLFFWEKNCGLQDFKFLRQRGVERNIF